MSISAIEKDTKEQYKEFTKWFAELDELILKKPMIYLIAQYQDRNKKFLPKMWCDALMPELREMLKTAEEGKITIFELNHMLLLAVNMIRKQLKELSELGE